MKQIYCRKRNIFLCMKINLTPWKVLNKSETMESVNKSPSKDLNLIMGFISHKKIRKTLKERKLR